MKKGDIEFKEPYFTKSHYFMSFDKACSSNSTFGSHVDINFNRYDPFPKKKARIFKGIRKLVRKILKDWKPTGEMGSHTYWVIEINVNSNDTMDAHIKRRAGDRGKCSWNIDGNLLPIKDR